MALISRAHKFIFFHTAKTGGSSMKKALRPFVDEETENLHTIAEDVKISHPEEFKSFFKFCFVRNPWDWQVSQYEFIRQYPSHGHHKIVKTMTFHDFLIFQTQPPQKVFQWVVSHDQQKKCLIDYIGRFENLQYDFSKICNIIGIEGKLPHVNGTKHTDYKTYYKNQEDMNIINYHYKNDIELFGYSF